MKLLKNLGMMVIFFMAGYGYMELYKMYKNKKLDSNVYCLDKKRWVIDTDVAYPLNDTCKPTDKPIKWDHNLRSKYVLFSQIWQFNN